MNWPQMFGLIVCCAIAVATLVTLYRKMRTPWYHTGLRKLAHDVADKHGNGVLDAAFFEQVAQMWSESDFGRGRSPARALNVMFTAGSLIPPIDFPDDYRKGELYGVQMAYIGLLNNRGQQAHTFGPR
ncbi:MAG: hypothetical protein Greene041619_843 [Candidatus Peregrinibacteria bacterium Greene0416_19]|nr:MAG: hypothetical protein Greene041619_843 [Candidatus Peregrinibacteria bacterium Greene0416_19]